jgi:3-methyladenine DNA glycosylase AlkD
MQSEKFEEVSYAIICVAHFKNEFSHEHFQRVGRWLETGIRNWAHTDILCSEILSPCLVQQIVTLEEMADWRTSEHKYKRRAVPVAMIPWIKKTRKPKPAIHFIDSMMLDPERVVHQGLGWFLREAWKIDPKPVETHLKKWKESAPRLIFQYATEKMTKEQKEAFRRTIKKK